MAIGGEILVIFHTCINNMQSTNINSFKIICMHGIRKFVTFNIVNEVLFSVELG